MPNAPYKVEIVNRDSLIELKREINNFFSYSIGIQLVDIQYKIDDKSEKNKISYLAFITYKE